MDLIDTIQELKSFLASYYSEIQNTDDSEKLKIEISPKTIDACEDAIKRLADIYPISDGEDYAYPKNLMIEIGLDIIDTMNYKMEDIEYALSTLEDREQEIIRLCYKDRLPYYKIGKIVGLSAERVRQIKFKGLRKLRRPEIKVIVRQGQDIIKKRKETESEFQKATNDLCTEIENVRKNQRLIRTIMDTGKPIAEAEAIVREHYKMWDVDIEKMNLSAWSYNSLKRAGYNKISDLATVTVQDLMKVRNLGLKMMNEVVQALRDWGIVVRDIDDEF